MSRRSKHWKKILRQAGGNVDKVLPQRSLGEGVWLTKGTGEGGVEVKPGTGKGNVCSESVGSRKEQLIRKIAGSMK